MDENFPVQLARALRRAGHEVEHLVESDQRGVPDSFIKQRLAEDDSLVLLTQDTDFEDVAGATGGTVIISRVPQALPIGARVAIWLHALEPFLARRPPGRQFDLLESGELVSVDIRG